ncbi:MAG TPA: hypothetical protein GYA06_08265 [Chloroflexi bacterium]|nr:hypothetical protein [Chloroflexota bacterium]HPO58731.1 hypothetical protein [Anaerolineaceae bacterium]
MGELGYDKFFAEPDTVDSINCRVCGTRCDVERSVIGPTSLAEAYAMRGRWHDSFCCPYTDEPWHDQALRLKREYERTASKRLRALIQMDLDELLAEHLPPDHRVRRPE